MRNKLEKTFGYIFIATMLFGLCTYNWLYSQNGIISPILQSINNIITSIFIYNVYNNLKSLK